MKVLLDIKENKAAFVMELLKNLPFIKKEVLSASEAEFYTELNESIEQVKLHKQGKLKLKTAEELINEL